jgi:hypothetical protein
VPKTSRPSGSLARSARSFAHSKLIEAMGRDADEILSTLVFRGSRAKVEKLCVQGKPCLNG